MPRAGEDVADIAAVAFVRPGPEAFLGDDFGQRYDGGERRTDLVCEMSVPLIRREAAWHLAVWLNGLGRNCRRRCGILVCWRVDARRDPRGALPNAPRNLAQR